MTHPSRRYTRLLNTLIDERIASAPRRSPWFALTPDERASYLTEVDRRLLDMRDTTLNVLAAHYQAMEDNPRAIDEHLALLTQRREQLNADSHYRQRLDDDIRLYTRQREARHSFDSAWRKALRLVRAANGLEIPCAGVPVRLQRLADVLRRKYETDPRQVLFARQQGWLAFAERYRQLLSAPPEKLETARARLSEPPPDSNVLPVNLSLLLMEERPGYVRMTVSLVDASPDGRFKDLCLDRGRLLVQSRGMLYVSIGTPARALAWQQHYRLKQEPRRAPTLAPIRSVLMRTAFVVALLGEFLASEHSQRRGFFIRRLDDGSRLRSLNVDRKVPNQIGIDVLDDPQRLSDLINRYADIASFQTVALDDYSTTWYDPDRDGAFVSLPVLERSIGFGERVYLLECPAAEGFLSATPFEVVDVTGARHLSLQEVRQTFAHNAAFFERLEALRGEAPCPWLNSSKARADFCEHWLRLLERNHLTPGGMLPRVVDPRAALRDVKGNACKAMAEEQALVESLWAWPALETTLFALGQRLAERSALHTLLENSEVQCVLAQAGQLLGPALEPMPFTDSASLLLQQMLRGAAGVEIENRVRRQWANAVLQSEDGRGLRRQAIARVLWTHGTEQRPGGRPDAALLLNAGVDSRPWLIGQDKYRGYHQFVADPEHPDIRLMDAVDAPVIGGLSHIRWQSLSALPHEAEGLPAYWRFQLILSAFALRNGYHSLFETLYPAAQDEPAGPGAIGPALLKHFGEPAWLDHAMALILPVANCDLPPDSHFSWLEARPSE